MSFKSTKLYDGFSTVFRQPTAEGTHCKFLHGYGTSFRVTFEGELDSRNWVFDYGGMKRTKNTIGDTGMTPKDWMDYMFDHTVILGEDDPALDKFKELDDMGIVQLRILPAVGTEKFAEYIYKNLNEFVKKDTNGRVRVTQVEFREHEKNSAIYTED